MINIDIWGTCYSRELFNHSNDFIVNNYLMQQSIYTIDQKSLNIEQCSIQTTDRYKFKERMMYYELNKLAIKALKEKHCDLILVDLFDQIRNYLQILNKTDTKMIDTTEMRVLLSKLGFEYKTSDPQLLDYNVLKKYIAKYIEILVSIYNKNNIILNISQLPHDYYENGKIKEFTNNWIIDRESFLKEVEKVFIDLLPECMILKTKHIPIVDINHYLGGPHPVHYEQIYYKYRVSVLNAYLNDKSIKEIEDKYIYEFNKNCSAIKKKKIDFSLRNSKIDFR